MPAYFKPKRTPEDLVSMMKEEKGIHFMYCSEDEATEYLRDANNYYRLASYRKNYDKHRDGPKAGKYIDLDFGCLKELAIIDMHLRSILLHMCLDIEHCMKVQLIAAVVQSETEDGYTIVEEFLSKNDWLLREIYYKRDSVYVGDLICKFFRFNVQASAADLLSSESVDHNCPIWAFMEILTFGAFIRFYDFYYGTHSRGKNLISELRLVKSLRNACAHNNCLIHNIRKSTNTHPTAHISQFVSPFTSRSERKERLSVRPMLEITALLLIYDEVVGAAMKCHRYQELEDLVLSRMVLHAEYFQGQYILKAAYNFFKKILDFLVADVV